MAPAQSPYLRPSAPRVKRCIVCGRSFTPRRSHAKTCSDDCRRALYRQRRTAGMIRTAEGR